MSGRDLSSYVGKRYTSPRFPFNRMDRVGDFFTAPDVGSRTLSSIVSKHYAGTGGRRFATFPVDGGEATRVFLVDIDRTVSNG